MTADYEITFKQWLKEHLGLVFRVVRAYGSTTDDQDDLFQEICLQIWFSVPRFAGQAKVSTWIYKVALNTAIVWNRGEKRRRRHSRQFTAFFRPQNDCSGLPDEIIERLNNF